MHTAHSLFHHHRPLPIHASFYCQNAWQDQPDLIFLTRCFKRAISAFRFCSLVGNEDVYLRSLRLKPPLLFSFIPIMTQCTTGNCWLNFFASTCFATKLLLENNTAILTQTTSPTRTALSNTLCLLCCCSSEAFSVSIVSDALKARRFCQSAMRRTIKYSPSAMIGMIVVGRTR